MRFINFIFSVAPVNLFFADDDDDDPDLICAVPRTSCLGVSCFLFVGSCLLLLEGVWGDFGGLVVPGFHMFVISSAFYNIYVVVVSQSKKYF